MYAYSWFTLLYSWNQHNIVKQLSSDLKEIGGKKVEAVRMISMFMNQVTEWIGENTMNWNRNTGEITDRAHNTEFIVRSV